MKKLFVASVICMCGLLSTAMAEDQSPAVSGEKLFARHCAVCHPQGGNIINPKKTLKKADLEARNIKSEEELVAFFRTGAPGMPKFDETAIPNNDARELARYILKTFK